MTLERGSLLNKRYRIVEILGQGGMAAVYRAVDENLGVEVAVKENLFTTEEYSRQFRREAVILANLRHPNLPRVTDHFVIEQRGQYLVMDYIEGEDLRQRMDRLGSCAEQEAIVIGVALCDALIYMHTRKPAVLHRDLKPGNVKITPRGDIFLVDFGLAKVMHGRQATTTGARAMTPGYSPPEQYGTARTDHRSDVYSLGATLFSALTDVIPEDGLARAMDQAVLTPITKHNPKVSRRLSSVIEKALAVRPDDRYQSAEEFRTDLMNARTTTRRRLPLELTLTPAIAVENQGIFFGDEVEPEDKKEPQADDSAGVALPISKPLPDLPYEQPRPKKRGKRQSWIYGLLLVFLLLSAFIVFWGNPALNQQVKTWLGVPAVVTSTMTNTGMPPTPTKTAPPAVVVVLPSSTPSVTPTVTASPTRTPTATNTPAPTRTHTPKPTRTSTLVPSPTALGGGMGQIVFASDRSGTPNLWLMDLDGNNILQLTNLSQGACQPNWHPDGNKLAFISPCSKNEELYSGSSIFVINADGSGLAPIFSSVPGGDFNPTWSPDGTKVAFTSFRGGDIPQIYIFDTLTNETALISDEEGRLCQEPAWSPDGKFIVISVGSATIRVMQADGKNSFLVARNVGAARNTDPVWSPTGLAIVFTQWASDLSGSWLMALPYSTEGAVPVKIPGSDYGLEPDFSPDGYWLVYTEFSKSKRDLYIMTVSGVEQQQITLDSANDFDAAWRPVARNP